MVLPSYAQETQFFKAMKTNDFSEVVGFLGKRLDLCIYENQNLYLKSEAIKKISNWINEKNVKSISEVHSGNSGDNKSQYRVAQIEAIDGLYRVFVYVSDENGKKIIKKIQIDRF
jgi:hypothetical protein